MTGQEPSLRQGMRIAVQMFRLQMILAQGSITL